MKKIYIILTIILSFLFICIKGQTNIVISNVIISDAFEQKPLLFEVDLNQVSNIKNILLYYKTFGQSEFLQKEMQISGRKATYEISANEVIAPFVEYYIKVVTNNNQNEFYPFEEGTTIKLQINMLSDKDKQIVVLSPEPNSVASIDDLIISFSLLGVDENVKREKTKLYINNIDITENTIIAGDLIIYVAANSSLALKEGQQIIKLELYDDNNLYHTYSYSVNAVTKNEYQTYVDDFKYRLNLQGESRSENFNKSSTSYNNFLGNFNASYNSWDIKANLYFTSEEKNNLQPFNRYSLSIKNDWLGLSVGDNYPIYPELIMNGKRLRGFTGNISLGFFNIQASVGETERSIEGLILENYNRNNAPLSYDVISVDSIKYGSPFARIKNGTYKRNIFAVRPSFGKGENFQFGLSYLHSKDDAGSISLGTRPQENVVVGTDLTLAFDNRNFLLFSQAAVSIRNTDISNGDFTDAQIDSIFATGSKFDSNPQDIKDIKNILRKFITVNENLGPLNPQEFSSLAAETGLTLNYFDNNLTIKYLYRGNEFHSFGNNYLRKDIKGLSIIDRIRLMDNKLFFNIGYEKLFDNLQETKIATTSFQTINTSISYFPRTDFPNITIGFTRNNNDNGISINDFSRNDYQINDITNKIYLSLSYDIKSVINHRAAINLSFSKRDDQTKYNIDSKTTSLMLMFNSFWTKDLSSFVNMTIYSSEYNDLFALNEFKYTSLSIGGKYYLLDRQLLLEASVSPSFGDFKRQAFDLVASYVIVQNLTLETQFRIYRTPDISTDSIIGAALRYNL